MAVNYTLFIDENYLRANSTVDLNVDSKIIGPSVYDAQTKYILPLIGSGLYDEISTQIQTNTVSTVNRALLDLQVKPTLAKYTLVELLPLLHFKFTNKGIMKQLSDSNQPVDFKEFNAIKDWLYDAAQLAADSITLYLIENSSSFPLFTQPGNGVDVVHPNLSSSFHMGIYTTGRNRRRYGFQGSNLDN